MIDLVEFSVNSVINHIQDNIGEKLDALAIDRPDGIVTLENPSLDAYFNYEKGIGYKTPAIFVVPTNVDFRLNLGQNHINAKISMYVSCVVEDRKQSLLQSKCFRYADALRQTLNQVTIDGENQRVIIKVTRIDYSGTAPARSTQDGPFRKECMLTLDVEHYEKDT
jgi:hypothetical protein